MTDPGPSYETLLHHYFVAQCSVIAEHSGDIHGDIRALHVSVSEWAENRGVNPPALPDWMDETP